MAPTSVLEFRRFSPERLQRPHTRTPPATGFGLVTESRRGRRCRIWSRITNVEGHHPVMYEVEHELGTVIIRNLGDDDINSAAVLLSRSFAGRDWQSLEKVKSYLQMACDWFPSSILLVAMLFPENDADALTPKDGSRMVALADVALSDALLPDIVPKQYADIPEDSAYLSNMCVDPKYRGCGLGNSMLQACDRAVQDLGECSRISLHVDADVAPFYLKNGYVKASLGLLSLLQPGPAVLTKEV